MGSATEVQAMIYTMIAILLLPTLFVLFAARQMSETQPQRVRISCKTPKD